MARLQTLLAIRNSLKAALGRSLSSGTGDDAILNQLISDRQNWLATEYDWPFLEDRFDIVIPPQSRYLSFPTLDDEGDTTAMNLERPYKVEVLWSSKWSPLDYGIGSEQFNYISSDPPTQYQDPIQRWRWSQEGKFEIWPVNTTQQLVRFTGQRQLDTLTTDAATADLDDQIIWMSVAAQMLYRSKQADADYYERLYQARLRRVRSSYPSPGGLVFGTGGESRKPRLVSIKVGIAG